MFGKNADERFITIYKEGTLDGYKVIVDKETGVHYLYSWSGYSGGITPLLDKDGKVIVKSQNE
jgi:hypothetical protein